MKTLLAMITFCLLLIAQAVCEISGDPIPKLIVAGMGIITGLGIGQMIWDWLKNNFVRDK